MKEEENKKKGKEERNVDEEENKEYKETPGLVTGIAGKEKIYGIFKDANNEELDMEEYKLNEHTNGLGAVS